MAVDPRSIKRASKAASQKNPAAQGGFSQPGQASGYGGTSPLVSQYAQWNMGRAQTSLPRPSNVFTDGTFTPLTPIIGPGVNTPNDDGLTDPRRYETPVGWNMPIGTPGTEAGSGKLASFDNLRAVAELYSVAQACIDLRISEIRGLNWDIIPTKEAEKAMNGSPSLQADFHKRRAEALRFFKRPDSDFADFSSWLHAALYEVFTTDSLSLYRWPTRSKNGGLLGSNLGELALIDGTSIKPLIDVYGSRPKPPNIAYQQYLYGVPRTDLMSLPDPELITEKDDDGLVAAYRSNQLMYLPYNTRRRTPYGFAPIERALVPAMAGLNRQQYQLDYFTEGSIPGVFVSPGDTNMTFEQMRTLQDALNALAGDPAWKHKIIVLPPGTKVDPQKPLALADQFDEIIMTQMCMAYGVMPLELGIAPRVSTTQSNAAGNQMAKASSEVNKRKALKPLLMFLKSTIFDNVLHNICGQADMEWMWEGIEEGIDEESQVELLVAEINAGLKTIDEGRGERGMQPYGLPMTTEPLVLTSQGYLALGSIDPTTGKPVNAQPNAFAGQQEIDPNAPKDPGTGGTAAKPKTPPKGPDKPPASATPGHAGATAGAAAADRAVGSKPGPDQGKAKAALAELDLLRRKLKQGKAIDGWECRHIDETVLEHMLFGLRNGEDPSELVDQARKMVAVKSRLPLNSRRSDSLDGIKRDVASGLGKIANGLRTGRIAAPQFTTEGIKVLRDGIAQAMRAGAAHAMEDRGHPHSLKRADRRIAPTPNDPHGAVDVPGDVVDYSEHGSYHDLSAKLRDFWDGEADSQAEGQRPFLDRLGHFLTDAGSDSASLGSRLSAYAAQAMSAYENAYGVTTVAAAQVEADANGDDGETLDDGTELTPGEQIITWNTTDSECSMCAERDGQAYTMDTLPGWPGDGFFGDLCEGGPNCNCFLTYEDATGENTIKLDGYAAQRASEAADQADRLRQVNEARQVFVDSLPDAARARAQERDDVRQQLADDMGAHQGYTAWPADVAATDVRDRLDAQR